MCSVKTTAGKKIKKKLQNIFLSNSTIKWQTSIFAINQIIVLFSHFHGGIKIVFCSIVCSQDQRWWKGKMLQGLLQTTQVWTAQSSVLSHVWLFVTPWMEPISLLCLWSSPGKSTGGGYHFLFQGIFPTQGSNSGHLGLLDWQADSLSLHHLESPGLNCMGPPILGFFQK